MPKKFLAVYISISCDGVSALKEISFHQINFFVGGVTRIGIRRIKKHAIFFFTITRNKKNQQLKKRKQCLVLLIFYLVAVCK